MIAIVSYNFPLLHILVGILHTGFSKKSYGLYNKNYDWLISFKCKESVRVQSSAKIGLLSLGFAVEDYLVQSCQFL